MGVPGSLSDLSCNKQCSSDKYAFTYLLRSHICFFSKHNRKMFDSQCTINSINDHKRTSKNVDNILLNVDDQGHNVSTSNMF